ncbi:hypothetical protein XNC3_2130001 [Xenorhabdus nematophila F1]|nr:hypothetical protein XNC3_2130001 [Xenorhabdus nematophila F1]
MKIYLLDEISSIEIGICKNNYIVFLVTVCLEEYITSSLLSITYRDILSLRSQTVSFDELLPDYIRDFI